MKKIFQTISLLILLLIVVSVPKTYAQQMAFCDSLDNNGMVGRSDVFNIDNTRRMIATIVGSDDKPFNTSHLIFKCSVSVNDSVDRSMFVETYQINPASKLFGHVFIFRHPGKYKINVYTGEDKFLCGEALTITARKQAAGNAGFAAVLNEIVNDYPNDFYSLKGEKRGDALSDIVGLSWESTENLPGYEDAYITYITTFDERTSWHTTIIKTTDSIEAINKYIEISEKINSIKFDCCSFTNKEDTSQSGRIYKGKDFKWTVNSVNPGKDKKFAGMTLKLDITYASWLSSWEYIVQLTIRKKLFYED